MMKKWIKIIILSFLALMLLPACMHSSEDQLKAFDQHMKIVNEKERILSKTLNQMDLNQIHYLSQTDTTDKNKQAFNDIKKAIDQKLKPKFKDYKEEANQLPARDDTLKALKSTYLKGIDQKEHEIKQLDSFIALCQKSIQSNEKILDSTQAFEKHRSRVESQMNLAKQTEQGSRENEMLENKLISNNQAIKEIAEKSMNAKSEKAQLDAIHKEMLPLIQGQIKELNKTQLKDSATNNARQNAIEMYYKLERYYQERAKTIQYSEKLSKFDVNQLVTKGDDLERFDQPFEKEKGKLESK